MVIIECGGSTFTSLSTGSGMTGVLGTVSFLA